MDSKSKAIRRYGYMVTAAVTVSVAVLASCSSTPDSSRGATPENQTGEPQAETQDPSVLGSPFSDCSHGNTSKLQLNLRNKDKDLDLGPIEFTLDSHNNDGRPWYSFDSQYDQHKRILYMRACATNVHNDSDRKKIANDFRLRTGNGHGDMIAHTDFISYPSSNPSQLNLNFCGEISAMNYKNTAGESAVIKTCFGRGTKSSWYAGGDKGAGGSGTNDYVYRKKIVPCSYQADFRNAKADGLSFCLDGKITNNQFDYYGGGVHPNNVHILTPVGSITLDNDDKNQVAGQLSKIFKLSKRRIKTLIPKKIKSPTWEFKCPKSSPYCTDRGENYQISYSQPWAGVETRRSMDDGAQGANAKIVFEGFKRLTLAATAGHETSADAASWYHGKTGGDGHEVGAGVSEQKRPKTLNFGFCGQLVPSTGAEGVDLCLAQDHAFRGGAIPGDEWWAGGKSFKSLGKPVSLRKFLHKIVNDWVDEIDFGDWLEDNMPALVSLIQLIIEEYGDAGPENVEAAFMFSPKGGLVMMALDNTSANLLSALENTQLFNKTFFAFGLGLK